ncbi:MAG: NADH:flavin oxidoreductase/NADH oxidase family protein [Myxococcota bacterium]
MSDSSSRPGASALSRPLVLPCGVTLANRIAKAPMTEGLADPRNRATRRHQVLYERWSRGGAGLHITGNVQVDRRFLERPGNVAVDGNGGEAELAAYAEAGSVAGNALWMQIGHAGRQSPSYVATEPVAPSAVALEGPLAGFSAPPRALGEDEIRDVIGRFAKVAAAAKGAGFTGVQVHGAHGYLLSEFLSPRVNHRDDAWGGSLANRARLLLETVRAVRSVVGPDFPVSVKLNSADFQEDGFGLEESCRVVEWLGQEGVDLVEVSGGSYEMPAMMEGVDADDAPPVKESTRRREAYFLTYAQELRKVATMPLMVSGGFRSRAAMIEAIEADETDLVGIGRPFCIQPEIAAGLLDGSIERALPCQANIFWFYLQLFRLADGLEPDLGLDPDSAAGLLLPREMAAGAALQR